MIQKNKNIDIHEKVGLKFAPIGSEVPSPQVLASGKPPKLCQEVHLHSIRPLKAQVIEISKAEKVFFTKNLLHCTATTTPKNENVSLHSFYPLSFWITFNKASNVTGRATQSGRFYSSHTVAPFTGRPKSGQAKIAGPVILNVISPLLLGDC